MFTRIAVLAVLVLSPAVASAQATRPATPASDYPALRKRMEALSQEVKDLQEENAALRIHVAELQTLLANAPSTKPAVKTKVKTPGFANVGDTEEETYVALENYTRKVLSVSEGGKVVAFGFHPTYLTNGQSIFERCLTVFFSNGRVSQVEIHDPPLMER